MLEIWNQALFDDEELDNERGRIENYIARENKPHEPEHKPPIVVDSSVATSLIKQHINCYAKQCTRAAVHLAEEAALDQVFSQGIGAVGGEKASAEARYNTENQQVR